MKKCCVCLGWNALYKRHSHRETIAIPIAIANDIQTQIEAVEGIVAALGATFNSTLVPEMVVHCSPQL